MANDQCNDGLEKEISRVNPYLNVSLEDGSTDLIVMRRQFHACPSWETLEIDGFLLFENGSFGRRFADNRTFYKGDYCFYPHHLSSEIGKTKWMVYTYKKFEILPAYREFIILSQMCYIITVVVYLYLKKIRNLPGKCFICCILCRLVANCILLRNVFTFSSVINPLIGYFVLFLRLSDSLWLCAISRLVWKKIALLQNMSLESRYQFVTYCVFIFGTGALLTGFIFVMDQIWQADPDIFEYRPDGGVFKCRIQSRFRLVLPDLREWTGGDPNDLQPNHVHPDGEGSSESEEGSERI
ncbi:probable G-protein coupled receptor Mth-like 6 isoform X2 [Drosophila takahashii]|uniref:probable G-protein coupled receptor Mth-like 6 isoform X2 n=1 Tax=Drosophila takahashii TaxID=29030 RepID=UPI00389952F3